MPRFKVRDVRAIMKRFNINSGGTVNNFLPAPLAQEFIDFLNDLNVMRKIVNVFTLNSRTLKFPLINSLMSAYYVADGGEVTKTNFTTGSVTFDSKKLMSGFLMDTEVWEDGNVDLRPIAIAQFSEAMANAEERGMILGDTAHQATAATVAAATEDNWFTGDERLMFDGLVKLAGEAAAADPVTPAAGSDLSHSHINTAKFQLGKYGRNPRNLVALISSWQASRLRINTDLKDASITALMSSPIIDGQITILHGVPIMEVPALPDEEALVFFRNYAKLGDRRKIMIESDRLVDSDQTKWVASERIDFKFMRQEALLTIDNLSAATSSS